LFSTLDKIEGNFDNDQLCHIYSPADETSWSHGSL